MTYRLTDLDLELLGETSIAESNVNTHKKHHKGAQSKPNNTESSMDSITLEESHHQVMITGEDGAKPAATSPIKRNATDRSGDSSIVPPSKKRYDSKKVSATTEKGPSTTGDSRNGPSTTIPVVKQEPLLDASKSTMHGYSLRTRAAARQDRQMVPSMGTHGAFKSLNPEGRSTSRHASVRKSIHAHEGGVDSEVERGANNLWSILRTADSDSPDAEETITETTQASFKSPLDPFQSGSTSKSSSSPSKGSFLSTVLNDLPTKSGTTLTPDDSLESDLRIVPGVRSSIPQRKFRHRTAIRYDDPDATEDDRQPASTTPRKSQRPSFFPIASDHKGDTNTSTAGPKTPSKLCKTTGKPFDRSITVRATPRKRAPPLADFVSDQIAIPTSWAAAGEADKKLIQMKEEGSSWEAIRKMWKEMTGQGVAPSTLPNRYNRVKANLTVLQDGEHDILLQVVADIERTQKAEKWTKVAALMHSRGAGKYPADFLQKQYSAIS